VNKNKQLIEYFTIVLNKIAITEAGKILKRTEIHKTKNTEITYHNKAL